MSALSQSGCSTILQPRREQNAVRNRRNGRSPQAGLLVKSASAAMCSLARLPSRDEAYTERKRFLAQHGMAANLGADVMKIGRITVHASITDDRIVTPSGAALTASIAPASVSCAVWTSRASSLTLADTSARAAAPRPASTVLESCL